MENADWRTYEDLAFGWRINEDLANDFMANFVHANRVAPDRQEPSSSSGIVPFTGQAYRMRPDVVLVPEKPLKRARRENKRGETGGKRMRAMKRGDTVSSDSDDAEKEQKGAEGMAKEKTNHGDAVRSDSDEEGKAKKQDAENMNSALTQSRIAAEEQRVEQEEFDAVLKLSLSKF